MNKVTGNVMNLQHFHDFYFLEAILAAIGMAKSAKPEWKFRHSVERLENDVQEAFDSISHEIAFRVYVYLWASACGEARHTTSSYLDYRVRELHGGMRNDVYEKSLKYFPSDKNVEIIKKVFGQKGWSSSYGGKAWLSIVEGMEMYGKVSNATFIDHAVDLEHNGGCVFNKEAKFGLDCYAAYLSDHYYTVQMRQFCDFKFSKNILKDTPDFKVRVSPKVYNLFSRFINVIAETIDEKVDYTIAKRNLEPKLEWLSDFSVEWDYKEFTPEGTFDDGKKKLVKKETNKTVAKNKEYSSARSYRKGDRVIVHKQPEGTVGAGCYWVSEMNKYDGMVMKINYKTETNLYKLENSTWSFDKRWLEPVTKKENPELPKVGDIVTIKFDGENHRAGLVEEMKKFDGITGKVTDLHPYHGGKTFHVKGCDYWWIDYKWIVKEEKQTSPATVWYCDEWFSKSQLRKVRKERRPYSTCYECDRELRETEVYTSEIEGHDYCMSCYDDKFSGCDKCGSEVKKDEAVDAKHHHKYYWLCEKCAKNEMVKCEICEEYYDEFDVVYMEDTYGYQCADCSEGKLCRKCHEYYDDIDYHNRQEHPRRPEYKPVTLQVDGDGVFEVMRPFHWEVELIPQSTIDKINGWYGGVDTVKIGNSQGQKTVTAIVLKHKDINGLVLVDLETFNAKTGRYKFARNDKHNWTITNTETGYNIFTGVVHGDLETAKGLMLAIGKAIDWTKVTDLEYFLSHSQEKRLVFHAKDRYMEAK